MNKSSFKFLFLIAAGFGLHVIAGAEPVPLELREAIVFAHNHRLDLRVAEKETSMTQLMVEESRALFLPTIDIHGEAGTNVGNAKGGDGTITAQVNGEPVTINVGRGERHSRTLSAEATLNLYAGGAHYARLQQMQARVRGARAQTNAQRQAAVIEVATAHYALRKAHLEYKRATQAASFAEEEAMMLQASHQAGTISRIDFETRGLKRFESKSRLAVARAEKSRHWRLYLMALGLNPAEHQESESLTLNNDLSTKELLTLAVSLDETPPSIAAAQAEYEAAVAAVRMTASEYLPTIGVFARRTVGSDDGIGASSIDSNARGTMVGVRLQWTLFNGLRNSPRRQRSVMDAEIKRMNMQQKENEWAAQIQEKWHEIARLEISAELLRNRLSVLSLRVEVDKGRLRQGGLLPLQYKAALNAYTDAIYEMAALQLNIELAYIELVLRRGEGHG